MAKTLMRIKLYILRDWMSAFYKKKKLMIFLMRTFKHVWCISWYYYYYYTRLLHTHAHRIILYVCRRRRRRRCCTFLILYTSPCSVCLVVCEYSQRRRRRLLRIECNSAELPNIALQKCDE